MAKRHQKGKTKRRLSGDRWVITYPDGRIVHYKGKHVEKVEGYGTVAYYQDGLAHREDGPAYEDLEGTSVHYCEGNMHNDFGPSSVVSGQREYASHGKPLTEQQWTLEVCRRLRDGQ